MPTKSTGCSSDNGVKESMMKSEQRPEIKKREVVVGSKLAKKKRKSSEATQQRIFKRKLAKKLRASIWKGRCLKCQRNGKGSNYCRNKVCHDAPDWQVERDYRLLAAISHKDNRGTLNDRPTVIPGSYVPAHIATINSAYAQCIASRPWLVFGQPQCFQSIQQNALPVPYIQRPYTQYMNVHAVCQAPYVQHMQQHSSRQARFGYFGAEETDPVLIPPTRYFGQNGIYENPHI